MNLPNKICLVRITLVLVFVILLMVPALGVVGYRAATIVFIVASCTDWVDGYIARKYHLVTDLGKFLDPLADKLLVCTALICLTELGLAPFWFAAVVVARELIVSGLRAVAAKDQIVIAANYWGKAKTVFQIIAIVAILLQLPQPFTILLVIIAAALTVISAVKYLYDYRQVFQA